ncbi:aldose epimerase family protein [Lentilactobacillus sp. Marseille-Q4993]|uniref:aldose epimerase family protein n=1 Tax=Lentilactobacillus sp. Marseille-Q4993 TaxID=3039492 RepID=UPI0024BC364B|nr:aldose epimerase family protein [Lentilactobacillus sp. Marseille-Q4993]
MKTSSVVLDSYEGTDIKEFTVENSNGVRMSAITLGATFKELSVPTDGGHHKNLLRDFKSSAKYLDNPYYLCQAIGRTAGRIENGQIEIKGNKVQLLQNEGKTTLHGGPHGFNSRIWDGSVADDTITFTTHIDSGSDSYPGDMDVKIEYTLNDDNEATVKFTAKSDEDTLFNPTIHAYFNLSDDEDIFGQTLMIHSDNHLELKGDKTPSGNFIENKNTPYDFLSGANLKEALDKVEKQDGHAFDEVFAINKGLKDDEIATLEDPKSKRKVTIKSSRNGLVVFTPDGWKEDTGFENYGAIALEAQNIPDLTHHDNFEGKGNYFLDAGVEKSHSITYKVEF